MNPLRILHLEDNRADAELIRAEISAEYPDGRVTWVSRRLDFETALQAGGFDVILCDYMLPEWDGLAALALARERLPDVPLLFVSGTIGDESAVEALKRGATDYVLKDRLSRLIPCIRRAVQESQDRLARKRAEHDLHKTLNELLRSNRELQDFAHVASHDLQEPLRKIQAFSDRLESSYSEILDERGRDFLKRLRSAAGRMQTLIEDLLAFSRITSRVQPFETVDLEKIAREVLSDLEARIAQSEGRVELGALPAFEADPLQMRQLLQNLIGNALKFRRPDTPPIVKVEGTISNKSSDPLVQITVQDNGIGFDERYLDRLFKPFQRLHSGQSYEGTGIGLAICRKIIDRHKGSISATSTQNQGSTFTVTLPLKQPVTVGDNPP